MNFNENNLVLKGTPKNFGKYIFEVEINDGYGGTIKDKCEI